MTDITQRPYHSLSVIPDVDRKLLAELAKGKSLQRVADEFEVTDVAVLNRVRKYPEYKEQLKLSVDLRMGKREMELESAADNVSVTRADRLLGHARWLAERLDSETYGQRTQVDVNIDISQALSELSQRLAAQQPPQCTIEHNDVVEAQVIEDKQD